jgi:hypothetical protein
VADPRRCENVTAPGGLGGHRLCGGASVADGGRAESQDPPIDVIDEVVAVASQTLQYLGVVGVDRDDFLPCTLIKDRLQREYPGLSTILRGPGELVVTEVTNWMQSSVTGWLTFRVRGRPGMHGLPGNRSTDGAVAWSPRREPTNETI